MVTRQENQIVITIPATSPAETLAKLQRGIIEMVKTLLSMGTASKDLTLDRDTSEGCIYALDLLKESLFDPETIEAAQAVAGVMSKRAHNQANQG